MQRTNGTEYIILPASTQPTKPKPSLAERGELGPLPIKSMSRKVNK